MTRALTFIDLLGGGCVVEHDPHTDRATVRAGARVLTVPGQRLEEHAP